MRSPRPRATSGRSPGRRAGQSGLWPRRERGPQGRCPNPVWYQTSPTSRAPPRGPQAHSASSPVPTALARHLVAETVGVRSVHGSGRGGSSPWTPADRRPYFPGPHRRRQSPAGRSGVGARQGTRVVGIRWPLPCGPRGPVLRRDSGPDAVFQTQNERGRLERAEVNLQVRAGSSWRRHLEFLSVCVCTRVCAHVRGRCGKGDVPHLDGVSCVSLSVHEGRREQMCLLQLP